MKTARLLSLVATSVFVIGCSAPHILITSNKYHFPQSHTKIMTVAVITDVNDSSRFRIERNLSAGLADLGYNAVSALEEFGPTGLANMGHEATYLKLCNQGIDAVIVVTLIDKSKENRFRTRKHYVYADHYYYDRIWNYKNIQAEVWNPASGKHGSYFWEAILFNLTTLEAEFTIQSPTFTSIAYSRVNEFDKLLIKTMLKEKILQRQNSPLLRPF